MAEPRMVRAVGDFREMPATIVRQDELWPEDHPVVRAHPDWFDLPKQTRRAEPEKPVEQTTAAPGEKRTVRRG
jgi:hypothetical protein